MNTHDAAQGNINLIYRLSALRMTGCVLHLGAHPDDEDIGLLSYMAHKFGVRAVYWSATRGEGGQNRIGPYRGEALGESKKGDVKKHRIVHISNFRPIKNIEGVARIFLGIRKRIDAELWLVGDGQDMRKINRLFKQNGAKNDVHYWGLQHNVAPILVQTDLLLMPSLSESFGLCALEAMACGVPVLAAHVGGLPEVVLHGKTGFLFPVGNHSLAADLAVALLKDGVAHREMSKAAVRQARKFRKEQIVSMYEDFYERVLISCGFVPPASSADTLPGL